MMIRLLISVLLVVQPQQAQPQRSAKEFYDSGVTRAQKRDLDGAIDDMSRAIELNPRFVEAFIVRGQCLALKRNLDKALVDFDKVIELAPSLKGVEQIYSTRSIIRLSKGDIEGALKDLDQAIGLNPNFAEAYSNRGVIRFFRNDQAGAASDYEKALSLKPSLGTAYINRGILRYESGSLSEAMKDLSQAVELIPAAAKPHVELATLHTLAGEIDLAVTAVKKAYSLDPASFSEEDPGIASSPFKRIQGFIAANPTSARAYEARGLLRLAQGKRTEATEDFEKCVKLDPKLRSETDKLLKLTF